MGNTNNNYSKNNNASKKINDSENNLPKGDFIIWIDANINNLENLII